MEAGMSKEARALLDNPKTRFNIVGAYLVRKAKENAIAMRNFRSMGGMKMKKRHPYETTKYFLESIEGHAAELVNLLDGVHRDDCWIYDENIEKTIQDLKIRIDMLDVHHKDVKKARES